MRQLVSIQQIESLTPIPGADRIVSARILGWNCIVGKDQFQVGDLCAFCEPDSFMPIDPRYEFLRKNCLKVLEGQEGFRIKTIKMKGIISQGLVLQLSQFPELANSKLGDDVTEILKVKKYEVPEIEPGANLSSKRKSNWPGFITKTDETRIQTRGQILDRYDGVEFIATEKLDGTSSTYYMKDGHFGVCSRNFELEEEEGNTYWDMAKKYDLVNQIPEGFVVQGEIIGPGIQKNKYKLTERQLRVFNVYILDEGRYLNYCELETFCMVKGLDLVPKVSQFLLKHSIDEIVTMSIGASLLNSQHPREGLVFRPSKEIFHSRYGRVSFKAINPEFLLKYGE